MSAVGARKARAKEETTPEVRPAGGRDEQMVVVRPEVLDTVGHVLGNVFQRLYHLVDRVAEADPLTAEELRGTTGRLEGFLQLLLDYVSPTVPSLQFVSFADVAQSLARRLSEAFGGRVRVHVNAPPGGEVLVDPSSLSRAFELLASLLQGRPVAESAQAISVNLQGGPRWLRMSVSLVEGMVATQGSDSEMRWAVAAKMIETQGGTLGQQNGPSGEPRWEITLPLQS